MRRNFGAKALLYPMPVFIIGTYDTEGKPDAMNAAWGGIADDTRISICLSPEHKTVKNLLETKAFTVSMATAGQLQACDYVGIVSGNDTPDKFEKSGFHAVKSTFVNAPLIAELPFALECTVISFDAEHCLLIGEIVNVCADEKILNAHGKVDPSKLDPLTYDPSNHMYVKLGEVAGPAFKAGLALK